MLVQTRNTFVYEKINKSVAGTKLNLKKFNFKILNPIFIIDY